MQHFLEIPGTVNVVAAINLYLDNFLVKLSLGLELFLARTADSAIELLRVIITLIAFVKDRSHLPV